MDEQRPLIYVESTLSLGSPPDTLVDLERIVRVELAQASVRTLGEDGRVNNGAQEVVAHTLALEGLDPDGSTATFSLARAGGGGAAEFNVLPASTVPRELAKAMGSAQSIVV